MAKDKLSEELMHAIFSGNNELADSIRDKINNKYQNTAKDNTPKYVADTFGGSDISIKHIEKNMEQLFGKEWWELEIDTIKQLMTSKGIKMPPENNWDKIMAVKAVMNSDAPFFDYASFDHVSGPFNGIVNNFQTVTVPSPGMIICTIKSLNHLRPDRDKWFSDEVIDYIIEILLSYGIYAPPPTLYELIGKKMKNKISEDSLNMWKDIYSLYKKYNSGSLSPDEINSEEPANIQAKRLYKAELAGEQNFKGA